MTVIVTDDWGNVERIIHDVTPEQLKDLKAQLPPGWTAEEM
jgi:hypothetical protein